MNSHRFAALALLALVLTAYDRGGPVARAQTPPAPPAGRVPQTTDVVFDLAAAPAEGTVLTAPGGQVRVLFANRAPAAEYQVRRVDASGPPNPWAVPIPRVTYWPPGRVAQKGCEPFAEVISAYLSNDDERTAPERLQRIRSLSIPAECRPEVSAAEHVPRLMRAEVYQNLHAGGPVIPFTVERLDAQKAVVRSWKFELRLALPEYAWEFSNEQDFVAGEIARHITVVTGARAAAAPRIRASTPATDGALPTVALARATGEISVPVTGHVWNVDAYVPLAAQLLGKRKGTVSSTRRSAGADLTTPSINVLLEEDRRLSQASTLRPLDPALHEQAALLAASVGLREAAGVWSDLKPALVRVVAHLAVARALDPEASTEGRLAEVALLALGGRSKDALQRLDKMKPSLTSPAQRAWSAALRLRITGDWRADSSAAPAPLLERRERYRALLERRGPEAALGFLEGSKAEPLPDWGRIMLGGAYTVDAGHLLAPTALGAEAAEFAEVWKATEKAALAQEELGAALAGTRIPKLVEGGVLGFPFLRAFAVRHVLHAADRQDHFRTKMLGLHQEKDLPRAALKEALGGLAEFPLLILRWHEGNHQMHVVKEVCPDIADLARRKPDRVPVPIWRLASNLCSVERDSAALPALTRWLAPLVPRGTAHEAGSRMQMFFEALPPGARVGDWLQRQQGALDAWVSELHSQAPWDTAVVSMIVGRGPAQAGIEQTKALVGEVLDYDLSLMRQVAARSKSNPATYRPLAERIAALDASEWFTLGRYLADQGLNVEAAAAYEKGVENAEDRVLVSHHVDWLIDHYLNLADVSRAQSLATLAAEVGSQRGLLSRARLHERLGELDAAESIYRSTDERYKDGESLHLFQLRRHVRSGVDASTAGVKEALQKLFPAGLRQVTVTSVSTPAAERRLPLASVNFPSVGAVPNDRLLALDGYVVETDAQIRAVLTFSDEPRATLLVWREGKAIELTGKVARRLYGRPASVAAKP